MKLSIFVQPDTVLSKIGKIGKYHYDNITKFYKSKIIWM